MKRLQAQLQRLYAPQAAAGGGANSSPALVDAQARVRAMVIEVARPANWLALSKVWHGVQVGLELPAPAIAVSGKDAYQLWFSLAEPVPAAQAIAFLDALRARFLADIPPARIAMLPRLDSSSPTALLHAARVPAAQPDSGLWSAFVAADLAPVFAAEPWLDIAPNLDGQADLLAGLRSMPVTDFERALDRLRPEVAWLQTDAGPSPAGRPAQPAGRPETSVMPPSTRAMPSGARQAPKEFLLDVMNDVTAELGLRIEAAKALLPYCDDTPRR